MTITHEVAVSLVSIELNPMSIDVKATIRSYRERGMLFWYTKELASEETKRLSFIYSKGEWYQIIDSEPVRCQYYVETHPGRFYLTQLSTLWNNENNLIAAKEALQMKLQKDATS